MARRNLRYEWLVDVVGRETDECIIWPFQKDSGGYGRVRPLYNGKRITVGAHRLAFKLKNGHYPHNLAMHSCDTPSCVNPKHLIDGEHKDNQRDKALRGRSLKGSKQYSAKLDEQAVAVIREEYASGDVSMYALAERYNISRASIRMAIRGEKWKHVDNPVNNVTFVKRLKTHCKRGHELSAENLYIYGKIRQCKKCTQYRGSRIIS